MKKKQKKESGDRSLKKVLLFCLVVSILIILSIMVRILYVVVNSKYDGSNRFTISVTESPHKAYILSFNPMDRTISEVILTGDRKNTSAGKLLGIPVTGSVKLTEGVKLNDIDPPDILFYLLMQTNIPKKNMTFIDIFRLYLFSRTLSATGTTITALNFPRDWQSFDMIASKLFTDELIINEKKSIEIINGTGIDGLGKRLERVISNTGGNVVSVSNSRNIVQSSVILYYQEISYTEKKIQQFLNYTPSPMQDKGIADIKIIIGTDGVREDLF